MPKIPGLIGTPTNRLINTWIGIDPGQKGGIATISKNEVGKIDVDYQVMPETMLEIGQILKAISLYDGEVVAVIERVHSMPKQSAQSGFTFGRGVGWLEMALSLLGISAEPVDPRKWMKELSIPTRGKDISKTEGKEILRLHAQRLFPALPIWKEPKSKGRQLAICDSLLLAHYARKVYP